MILYIVLSHALEATHNWNYPDTCDKNLVLKATVSLGEQAHTHLSYNQSTRVCVTLLVYHTLSTCSFLASFQVQRSQHNYYKFPLLWVHGRWIFVSDDHTITLCFFYIGSKVITSTCVQRLGTKVALRPSVSIIYCTDNCIDAGVFTTQVAYIAHVCVHVYIIYIRITVPIGTCVVALAEDFHNYTHYTYVYVRRYVITYGVHATLILYHVHGNTECVRVIPSHISLQLINTDNCV